MLIVTVAAGDEAVSAEVVMTRIRVTIHGGDVTAKLARKMARKDFKEQHPAAKLGELQTVVIPFEVVEAEFMNTLAKQLGDVVTAKLTKADANMKGEKLQ